MKSLLLIILCLQLIACSSRLNLNVAQLTFVETRIANLSSEPGQVRYVMRYKLDNDAPEDLYARVHYQDLANKNIYHTRALGNLGKSKILNFNSLPEAAIVNIQYYEISLLLYTDAQYNNAVGIHRDQLWFEMPATVAEILKIKLL